MPGRIALSAVFALVASGCVGGGRSPASPTPTGVPGSTGTAPSSTPIYPACVKLTTADGTGSGRDRSSPVPVPLETAKVGPPGYSGHGVITAGPAARRVLVTVGPRPSIAIVDGASLRVVARVRVGGASIGGLAQDPRTGLVYVVGTNGVASVVDPSRARMVREVRFAPPRTVGDVVDAAIGGGKLWVAADALLVLDLRTLQVVDRIGRWRFGSLPPIGVIVDPSRPLVYVTSALRLAVISTATNEVLRCVKTWGYLALDPERDLLYLATATRDHSAVLRVIDASSMKLVATVRGGLVPVDVELDPIARLVYVVDQGAYNIEPGAVQPNAGLVWVVDARTNRLVRTLSIGMSPTGGALSADGRSLFLADPGAGGVSRIAVP